MPYPSLSPRQLIRLREQLGSVLGIDMTQAEFARRYHISKATLSNWEKGKRRPIGPSLAFWY